MINKIIVFGSNGMLGNYIKQYFSKKEVELICITRNEFEISSSNISNLEPFLHGFNINEHTCVINCNGLIPQRIDRKDNSEYYIINSVFPLYLSRVCDKYNSKLICPTTDCVFSGKAGKYNETDFHDEVNAYGISKSLGEPANATIIRTSIIGEEINNKKSFLEFVKNSSGEINGWDNHYWNGITCLEYCKIIDKIITENLFWSGVRHIYSPEIKSKYEMACIIKEVYNIPITIKKIQASTVIDKTLVSNYKTNELFGIKSLEEQIYELSHYRI